ncbi:MAG TPA: phenylalanine--tRNA ligase subunit beta [Candidatus Ozemobacteraceae bacterium]
MKILLSWLRDYIDIQVTPEQIADALQMAGIEVESIHQPGKGLSKVVVGQILTRGPHPNADKLSICTVNVGAADPLKIVCGAPNCDAGNKVPVAMIGASLPTGFEIRKAKIRGEESFGMMCSRRELGISDEHEGLWLLPPEANIGEDIVKAAGMDDVIFEISITPNRGDALSHLGIARELSAIFNLPLHREGLAGHAGEGDVSSQTSVTIEAPDLCPRYGARIVRNVRVGPSPRWMKDRLEKVGLRAINNVVDVTNYILMDIGHPMHAFDLDRLEENRIVVRRASEGEKIRTLDGTDRKLTSEMLVIADAAQPVAIAGVMGGFNTMVTDATSSILLEAAVFDPISVRKTSKQLALMSDSSYRFERGTNIDNVPIALNEAARLLGEIAGGKAAAGIVDAYPAPAPLKRLMLRTRRTCRLIGVDLKPQQIETLLLRLKFEVTREGETLWVGVPPYRHDIEQEADLIEEVARLYGYNNIPAKLPAISAAPRLETPLQALTKRIRDHLTSLGLHETMTYSFIPAATPAELAEGEPLKLQNPLSEELAVMRTGLLSGMIDAVKRNVMADEYDLPLFEMGRVFHRGAGGLSQEFDRLCIGLCGSANASDWHRSREPNDLYRLKGLVTTIGHLAGQQIQFKPGTSPALHPSCQFQVLVGNKPAGILGQINPKWLDNRKLPREIFFAEIDIGLIASLPRPMPRFKAIPEFPAIRRDLALLLPVTIQHDQVIGIVKAEAGPLLEDVRLFDVYQGKGLEPGRRSLAFSLTFRSPERTLTEEDVQPRIDAVVAKIGRDLDGRLRDK